MTIIEFALFMEFLSFTIEHLLNNEKILLNLKIGVLFENLNFIQTKNSSSQL